MTAKCLLNLNIAPDLEEEFVDVLLSSSSITGYQSYPTLGHGPVGAMSIAEQVAGRRARVQFEILLSADVLEAVLQLLHSAFPTADIRYWVVPVGQSGHLTDLPES